MKLNHQIVSQLTILFITVYNASNAMNACNIMHGMQCLGYNSTMGYYNVIVGIVMPIISTILKSNRFHTVSYYIVLYSTM
jgi:hypothetical protein